MCKNPDILRKNQLAVYALGCAETDLTDGGVEFVETLVETLECASLTVSDPPVGDISSNATLRASALISDAKTLVCTGAI